MKFLSIHLQEGFFEKKIDFSARNNLITSDGNSRGKTTLLRFLLYGLGYQIPSTKLINFNKCFVELRIEINEGIEIRITRDSERYITVSDSKNKQTFILPEQQIEFHRKLFGIENDLIVNNLLGTFYLDQEKGWTLLNRGKIIGRIGFSIEELIRGLSNIDASSYINQRDHIFNSLKKYRSIRSISEYQKRVKPPLDDLVSMSFDEKYTSQVSALEFEKKELQNELRRIDRILSGNSAFKDFIVKLGLLVEAPDGSRFPLSEENIVGLTDSIDMLIYKKKNITQNLADVLTNLKEFKQEETHHKSELKFFDGESIADVFDKKLLQIPINQVAIEKEIDRLEAQLRTVNHQIQNFTTANNQVLTEMTKDYIKFASELGLEEKGSIKGNDLLTSDLKGLSGAILHLNAFAFRLTYINAIKRELNIILPIILDSPKGKEIDDVNTKIMMSLLEKDFSDHQLIIASIYNYEITPLKVIRLGDFLIDEEISSIS